jgi:hypothetical protein
MTCSTTSPGAWCSPEVVLLFVQAAAYLAARRRRWAALAPRPPQVEGSAWAALRHRPLGALEPPPRPRLQRLRLLPPPLRRHSRVLAPPPRRPPAQLRPLRRLLAPLAPPPPRHLPPRPPPRLHPHSQVSEPLPQVRLCPPHQLCLPHPPPQQDSAWAVPPLPAALQHRPQLAHLRCHSRLEARPLLHRPLRRPQRQHQPQAWAVLVSLAARRRQAQQVGLPAVLHSVAAPAPLSLSCTHCALLGRLADSSLFLC